MNASCRELKPVPVRRYRYSKWRWRVLVHVIDFLGGLAMRLWRVARKAPRVDWPRRILIVQLDHLGDAVLTSPLFPALRARYPEARIDVVASPSGRGVFEARPEVANVWLAERNWFERRPGGWACLSAVWALGRRLRRERYDLGIDVRGDVLTVLVLALAGIPRRLGWAMGGGGFLLTDVVEWIPGRHEVASRMALAEALGAEAGGPVRVDVHVTDDDRARIARGLASAWPGAESGRPVRRPARRAVRVAVGGARSRVRPPELVAYRDAGTSWSVDPEALHAGRFGPEPPLVAIHLGAGTAAKRWPIRSWQRLIDHFLQDGWRVVIVGGTDDVERSRTILPHENLCDWTGRLSVGETTALLERADLFLGVDSGPAHLAAAAATTSVVLFSGTNRVRQWRPWSRRALVLRRRVKCGPCHRKACPLADHPCMSGLDPDAVYRAAWRWWNRLNGELASHGGF